MPSAPNAYPWTIVRRATATTFPFAKAKPLVDAVNTISQNRSCRRAFEGW